jgi:hypothetical protein
MGATCPLTLTQPLAIQSSASRREAQAQSAMRLFRRTVPVGAGARVTAPAGAAARRTAVEGPDAAEAGFGAVSVARLNIVITITSVA